jgi:peptidoglycan hydrolase CwlO-like protein
MRQLIGLVFIVFIGLFVYLVFIKNEPFNAATVKQEFSRGADAAQKLVSDKEDILKRATDEVRNVELQIENMKKKVSEGKAKADEVQQKIEELNRKRNALEGQVDSVKASGENAWKNVKKNFDSALEALKKAEQEVAK